MKKILFIIIIALAFGFISNSLINIHEGKNQSEVQLEVNKNYMFCVGMAYINIEYQNKCSVIDGSSEVYFINDLLVVDGDEGRAFVKEYLDSLKQINAFKSYNNNSLGIAKCLDMYNSKKLDDFVKQKIEESKKN